MPFTDSFLDGLMTEGVDNDGHRPRRPITYDDMRSIADYASRRFGTEFEVGPSGDGMVSGTQSTVSMADMVWTDVGEIQPRVSKLVGMIDGEACFPIYQFLRSQLDRVDPTSTTQVCMPLYPDARARDELEYLPECRRNGLTEADLLNTGASRKLSSGQMSLGLLMEIHRYIDKYSSINKIDRFHNIICSLFEVTKMTDTEKNTMHVRVKREVDRMKKMKKAKQTSQIEMLKRELFDMPGSSDALVNRLKSLNLKVGEVSIPLELRGLVESLANAFSSMQEEHQKLVTRNQQLEEEKRQSEQRDDATTTQHQKETEELKSRLSEKSRQLKATRRLKDHYKEMAEKARSKTEAIQQQQEVGRGAEERVQEMSNTITELEREKVNLKEQVRYYKGIDNQRPDNIVFSRRIDELKEEVAFWQGQYLECQEQMEAFLNQREIVTFHDGRYTDIIREVYMELMCMRVGAKNVPKIIKTVMEKMTGMTPQRLPGSTFAKYMLLEARSVALVHLKEEIQSSEGNITVGPDGTTKFGHHYGAISISLSGKTMCMGMRDMACGDAEAYRKLLEGIITEMTGDDNDQVRQVAVKIKNTVSDQASVNKKFVTLLSEWREKALPHVVENWDTLTAVQRERYVTINYFFCGLHFLVGLSEQANKTLSLWESLVHSGEKVGAPTLPGGYSIPGESGTTRLVRTVCKAVQDRGCEKAGKPVQFRGLFTDSRAGVYYLLNDLLSFAEEHKTDNRLFTAVNADLCILSFQAGARALGIVSKMVTGPMWRFMEENGHVSELTPLYQQLYDAFKRLSTDASTLMKGEEFIFGEETVQKDKVFDKLVSPSPQLDNLTQQILELLFSSFKVVCSRQLKDHIEGGKYATDWSPELLEESATVPRTNVGPERIFSQLDSLIRVMPRATTNAMEGITMWTQNHTANWLESLDEAHREQVLRQAREDSREQRQRYVERLADIRQQRQEALAMKREKKEAKEQRDRAKKEELTQKLQEVGGLWKTPSEIDRQLLSLQSGQRVKALQTQLTFRRYVLGTPNAGKILNVMAGGKYLSAEKLTANLKCVLRQAEDEREERRAVQQVSGQANPLSSLSLQAEKEKFQKLAEEERQRNTEAPKKRQKTQGGTRSSRAVPNTPAPDKPEDLIGKRVQHLIEEFDGSSKWYYGIITGLKVRRGKYMYTLVYDGETETFSFPLLDDMEKDELRIVPLDPAFIVGRRVDHRFCREADGEEFWYTGTVTGHDADTGLSTIAYDFEDGDGEDDDDDDNNSNVFEEPVIEDYKNGDVRILL
ncbi:unnamed protein product [Mytilus coruscus]|uniref:Uncharacterized protein n=1 Tax=Mytilus coruscus TaxID=42192 RepID=A0A6J8E1D3_MYTCO|nr:unnamed protein product [Mytilus coruscus]